MRGDHVRGHVELLLLATLAGGPAHGYLVIKRLRDRSDRAFDLPEGSVYPALHRLERERLVTSRWSTGLKRRRRVYRLTRKGRKVLEDERREWKLLARAISAVVEPV